MGPERQSANANLLRWFDEARRLSAEEFCARHRGLFFLVAADDRAFTPHALAFATTESEGESSPGADEPETRVIPIAKSDRSPYRDRISVGRARNCDVVVRHPSVSKLHAHIRVAEDGGFTLTDVGSHNGTRVNDTALTPQVPVALSPGDVVVLGAVTAQALDGASLQQALLRECGHSSTRPPPRPSPSRRPPPRG